MYGHSPQLPLQGLRDFDIGSHSHAGSSETAAGYPSSQADGSGYPHRLIVEYSAQEWEHLGGMPEDVGYDVPPGGENTYDGITRAGAEESYLVADLSDTRRLPNIQGGHDTAEDTRRARPGERFPHQLYRMMESPRADGLIYWSPEGDEFIVSDSKALENAHILDKYFAHNSWGALVRQLNNYGFEKGNRAQKGSARHVYYHTDFQRGRRDLLDRIKAKQGPKSAKPSISRLQKEMDQMKKSIVVLKRDQTAQEHEIPSLTISPNMPQKAPYVSPQDDITLGTYSLHNMDDQSWMRLTSLPQACADYGGLQAIYNFKQDVKQTHGHMQSVSDEHQDLTYDHTVDLDTSSPFKNPPETYAQSGSNGFTKGTVQRNFVRKLYEMLGDPTANPYIRWYPDGKSFIIDNQEEFSKNVLGRYLRTEKFSSFIQRLNSYGFHGTRRAQRTQRGVQTQTTQFVFSHPKFQKDYPELLLETRIKGTELQDPLPQYSESLRLGTSPGPAHLPLSPPQSDHQAMILLQAENQRLKEEVARLNAVLSSSHSFLNAILQVHTLPQTQNVLSTPSASSYPTIYDTKPSQQYVDQMFNSNPFQFNHSASPPMPAEGAVVFPQFTGNPTGGTSYQAQPIAGTSYPHLDSTLEPGPSSNTHYPNVDAIPQPIPRQTRGEHKPRPPSWCESLGRWVSENLLLGGSYGEAGPSSTANACLQDAHKTPNSGYGRRAPGSRVEPVTLVRERR